MEHAQIVCAMLFLLLKGPWDEAKNISRTYAHIHMHTVNPEIVVIS
jgi:hypothetical protein